MRRNVAVRGRPYRGGRGSSGTICRLVAEQFNSPESPDETMEEPPMFVNGDFGVPVTRPQGDPVDVINLDTSNETEPSGIGESDVESKSTEVGNSEMDTTSDKEENPSEHMSVDSGSNRGSVSDNTGSESDIEPEPSRPETDNPQPTMSGCDRVYYTKADTYAMVVDPNGKVLYQQGLMRRFRFLNVEPEEEPMNFQTFVRDPPAEQVVSVGTQTDAVEPPLKEKTRTPDPPCKDPDSWLTNEDVLEIATTWHDELLAEEVDEATVNVASGNPTHVDTEAQNPEVTPSATTTGSKVFESEPRPLATNERRHHETSVRGRGFRQSNPTSMWTRRPQTHSRHDPARDAHAGSSDRRGQYRDNRSGMPNRHSGNYSRRPEPHGRTATHDLGTRAKGFCPAGYMPEASSVRNNTPPVPRTPSVPATNATREVTTERDNTDPQEEFDPWDERTWPESLRKLASDYQRRAQLGERFPRRGDLHFAGGNRYRVALKRDGRIHVTKLPPKTSE